MDRRGARRYLYRLGMLHAAPLVFFLGMLVAVLGAPELGLPALFAALVLWLMAVASAWVAALRERRDKPLFGPRSVTEDANERMGWGELGPATEVLELEARRVRWALIAAISLAVSAAVLTFALSAAGAGE
ncbi:MAG: hypothetical protein Q8K72_04835 [Acidimicrobiales bacterium]|nr:hypothetical protein [Acidimicrobiales bacterium]